VDIKAEIAARVDNLPPEMQAHVLRFVDSLASSARKGKNGSALRSFAGSLDPISAREMSKAIEEECERVDAGEW
jgi:hypothetical protein